MKWPPRTRWFAWWYAAIALGFVLLAIAQWMLQHRWGPVLLRLAVAAGFAALATLEFQTWKKR